MPEYFIGLMSGTSVDAIDSVLMDFAKSNTYIVTSYSQSISSQLRKDINSLVAAREQPKNIAQLDEQFAEISYKAVNKLLKQASIEASQVSAIGSHGQTVFHNPKGIPPVSIQIGNPKIIADYSKIPTVYNFRQADINAGGQGAPLACAYHAEVLQNASEERLILNLGGIANITKLPKGNDETIIGFDTGPANTLMDAWIQKHLKKSFDQDGKWAQRGKTNIALLEQMLQDVYFTNQPPKSTGREYFNLDWLQHQLDKYGIEVLPEDTQATLLALTVHTIANSIKTWCPQSKKILLCGGGSENKYFVQQLEKILDGKALQFTSDYGVPAKWMEAMAFAWLAKLYMGNKPGNIPSVTGAGKPVILGEIFCPI